MLQNISQNDSMGRDESRYTLKPFDRLNVFSNVFFNKSAFISGLDERKRLQSRAPSNFYSI